MKYYSHILFLIPLLFFINGCNYEPGDTKLSDSNSTTVTVIETNVSTETNESTETNTSTNTLTEAETVPTIFKSFSGKVVDGYIQDATICLDYNNNELCDFNESIIKTDTNGSFNFVDIPINNISLLKLLAYGGVDISTGKEFIDTYRNLVDPSSLDNEVIVSPITDLSVLALESYDEISLENLEKVKNEIALLLGMAREEIDQDPMSKVKVFAKAQEIEHTKLLLNTVVLKHKEQITREVQDLYIKNTIKKELFNVNFNIDHLIISMEIKLDIEIPENEQTFVVEQVTEIRRILDELVLDTTFNLEHLDRVQKSLDNVQTAVVDYLAISQEDAILPVVDINISEETVTQSTFDTQSALEDPLACIAKDGYTHLLNNANDTNISTDTNNGISIRSEYLVQNDLNASEIEFFYPNLTRSKTGEESIIFADNYYFVYDTAWPLSANRTVYMQIPGDANATHECYRYYLNTNKVSDIIPTKVFRYDDI